MALNIHSAINRFFTFDVPEDNTDTDMFLYRTRGEREYVRNLLTLTNRQLERWRNQTVIDPAAYKIPKPLLYADFRFIKKGQSEYWREDVRQERRLRSSHGWFLPWHIRHQGASRHAYNNTVLLRVPTG